jgi:shikimate kinase
MSAQHRLSDKTANIILIGMPGAGKSTVGVLLAKVLGMAFVDTDLLIQQQTGLLLQEIIDRDGIDRFIALEEAVLLGLGVQNSVIATGGSAVYSDRAMRALKRGGLVIYLSVTCAEITNRLRNSANRGIAIRAGDNLRDVCAEREPLYVQYSDIIFDNTGRDIEQGVQAAVEAVRAWHTVLT